MKPDPPRALLQRVPLTSLVLVAAFHMGVGCGDTDHTSEPRSGDSNGSREHGAGPRPEGPENAENAENPVRPDPSGAGEDNNHPAGEDVTDLAGDEQAPPSIEELERALEAVPPGLELVLDESVRLPGDPETWLPATTVGGAPVDILREYHPTSGTLMRIATVRLGDEDGTTPPVLHGVEWRYHETGSQRSVQWWRDDVPHGPVWQWRRVGVLARVGCFAAGQRDGLWREYSKNEKLMEQSVYVDGVRIGPRKTWFASGQAKVVENFKKGQLDGRRQVWGRNGVLLRDESYVAGDLHGRWSDFHGEGGDPRSWGNYDHGKRVGRWQRGSTDGVVIASLEYTEGVLCGQARVWNDKGELIEEYVYAEGAKTGLSRTWFADGRTQSEGHLENGRRTGRWTYWKSDGSVNARWSGRYEDDLRVGPLVDDQGGA